MAYLMGLDLGTSSVKCFFTDETGTRFWSAHSDYSVEVPQPGFAEQDPARWWAAAVCAIRRALEISGIPAGEIRAIGFSGQMHGAVLLDADGAPLCPAILHCDARSAREIESLRQTLGQETIETTLCNPLFSGAQLPSLVWVREHRPELFARIGTVLLPKDYLRYRLTGEIGTECTDASATLLYDVARGGWAEAALRAAGLRADQLPPISRPEELAGAVTPAAAAETGLRAGTPVVFGAGDQAAQLLGNGVIRPGMATSNIGTSGQICTPSAAPMRNPALNTNTFCHAAPGLWYTMGAMLSAGLSLKWLTGQVLRNGDYRALDEAAARLSPRRDDPIFLPYLCGERTPHLDPAARGVFFGLSLEHSDLHLYRAVMEGVAYALRDALLLLRSLGLPVETAIASGGGAASPLWLQIQADILGLEISTTACKEQAGLGAAILAAVGCGLYRDIPEACAAMVHPGRLHAKPDPEHQAVYEENYRVYQALYPRLAPLYRRES